MRHTKLHTIDEHDGGDMLHAPLAVDNNKGG